MSDTRVKSAIRLLGVTVERIEFVDTPAGEKRGDELLILYSIDRRLPTDASETLAACALRVSLRARPGDAPFSFDATIAGVFQRAGSDEELTLEKFMKINGPAQLVPFVREFVANVTARSRQGIILLPSVNVVQLVQQIEAESTGAARE
jgi:preprotein translocase subunit SecB